MKSFLARGLLLLLSIVAYGGAFATPPVDEVPAQQILVMLPMPPQHYRPTANYGGAYDDHAGRRARRRIAQKLAHDYGLTLLNDWPMPALDVDCYVMQAAANQPLQDLAGRLSDDPRTQWAQPMSVFHGLGHNDPLYPVQPSAKLWHLDELHAYTTGRGISVAVIDSGIDVGHPDLAGQVSVEQNFVDAREHVVEAHGTAVAGIIAARADNGVGIVGVAPQAKLMALRACWEAAAERTLCSTFTLAKALQFAIEANAMIINLSLTGPRDKLLERLLDVALKRGVTVVGAVDPEFPDGGFPAYHEGVLAVSDQPTTGRARPVLLAPGHDIATTAPGARWSFVSGSSFAAAHVAGMVALIKQLVPSATMRDARSWAIFAEDRNDELVGTIDTCSTVQRVATSFTCAQSTGQVLHSL